VVRHLLHPHLCNILQLSPRLLFSDHLILKMKSLLSYTKNGCGAESLGDCSAFASKFEVHDPCKILYYSPNEALSHTGKPKSSSILLVKDYFDYTLPECYAVCGLANVYQLTKHNNPLIFHRNGANFYTTLETSA